MFPMLGPWETIKIVICLQTAANWKNHVIHTQADFQFVWMTQEEYSILFIPPTYAFGMASETKKKTNKSIGGSYFELDMEEHTGSK